MQIRIRTILLFAIVALFIALVSTFVLTKRQVYDDLLLVAPKANQAVGVDDEKLEEINEEKCMLTYEVSQQKSIKTNFSNHTVIVTGTNYTYPFVMNHNLLSGSFFTKEAMEQKSRFVVLNKLAAFEIFGDTDIVGNEILLGNDSYRVIGVINDKDEDNQNVYVPISRFTEMPTVFMVKTDSRNHISSEFIENEFKQVGVTKNGYDFINLDRVSQINGEKTVVALKLIAWAGLFLMIKMGVKRFVSQRQVVAALSRQYDFRDFLQDRPRDMLMIGFTGISIGVMAGVWFWVSLQVVETLLRWNIDSHTLRGYSSDCFRIEVELLQNMTLYSGAFFVGFVIMIGLFLVSKWD